MHTTYKSRFAAIRTGLAIGAMALALTACGSNKWGFPYRADVQQGNWITAEQVAQLQQGMTREQVRFVLGTPTLQDIFHSDRWDYPYYHKPGYGEAQERKFTVWFQNDQLVRWSGDAQPDRQPYEPADTGMTELDPKAAPAPKDPDNVGRDEIQNSTGAGQTAIDSGSTETSSQPAQGPRAIINANPPQPSAPGVPSPSRSTGQPLL